MQHRFGNPKDTYFRRFVRPKGERLEARHLLTTTSIVVGDWLRIHGDETINNDQLRIENARASFLGLPSGFQAGDLHLGSVVAFDDNQDGEVDGVTLSDTLPIASVSLGLGQTEVIRLRAPALEFQEFVYRPYAADMEGSGAIVITAAAADAFPEDDEPRIGDLDEDGDVDADDRFRLRENWTGALSAGSGGKVRAEGDLDGDQDVDSLDYTLLVTHWTDTAKLARTPVGSIDVHTGALSMLVTALGGQPVRLNGLLPMMLSEITTEHVPHSDQVDYVATGVPDIDLLTRTWSSQLDSFALETSIDFFSTATNRYESYGGQSLEFELSVNEGTIVPADTPALRVHLQNVTMPINDQLDSVTLAGTIEAVGFDTRGVPRNGSGASADTSSDVYLRLIPDETSEVSGQVEAIGSWTFQPNGIALELQGVARLQQVEPLTGEPDSGSYVVAVHWPVAPRDPNSQPNDGLEVTAEINHPLIADPSTLNATSEGISVLQSVLTDLSSRLAVEPVSLPLLTDGMDAVQLLQSAVDPIAAVYLTEFNPTDAASLFAPPFTFICQSNDETCVSDEVFRASLHLTGAELPTTSIESQLDVSRIGALAEFAPGGTWSATQRPVGQIEFGVDAGGFFLDASSSIGSTILGTVTGAGSYGLLDVGLQGEFSFSPRLVFAPLDTNSDGKIHTSELTSEAWGVANVQLSHVEAELDVTLQNGLLDYVDVDANPANNSARGGDPFQFVARTRLASSTFSASGLEPTWSEITVLNPDVDGDQIDDFSFIQLTQNAELLARDVISGGRLALLSGIDEALRGVPVPLAAPGVHTSLAEALQFGTALSTATFDNVRVLDRVNTTRLANWLNVGFPETPDEIIRVSVDVAGIPLDGIEQLPLNLRSLFPSLTGDATARIRDARLSGELVLGIDTSTASPAYLLPSDTGLGAEFELVVDLSGQSLGDGMFRFDAAEAVLAPKIRLEFTGEDNVKFRLTDLFDQLPPIKRDVRRGFDLFADRRFGTTLSL